MLKKYPIVFENDLIVIVNISAELPQHKIKQYKQRDLDKIDRVYWHHTAGRIRKGLKGPIATAGFCVKDKKKGGRGWPGMPYHLYIPYEPEVTPSGQMVIYLCQPFELWTYHTGGKDRRGRSRNKHGVGVVCQGDFLSGHDPERVPVGGQSGYPSYAQMITSYALWTSYLKPVLGLNNKQLRGHFEAGKPTCPGDVFETWVKYIRMQS